MSGEFFWFTVRPRFSAHAFELVKGELAEKSLCGDAELVDAADEPQREPIPSTVQLCRVCHAAMKPEARA